MIPDPTPMPIPPLSGFAGYDDDFVLPETITGEQRLDNPDEVSIYVQAFERLRGAAVTGRDAVSLIRHSMTALRAGAQTGP